MNARNHGFFLVELIVTAGLIAVIVAMAMRVFASDIRTNWELQEADGQGAAMHQAMRLLREDVEHAAAVRVDGAALNTGPVQWSSENQTLIRTAGERVDRYDLFTAVPSFSQSDGIVTLTVGEAHVTLAPLLPKGTP